MLRVLGDVVLRGGRFVVQQAGGTLTEGTIVSKSAALRHVRDRFDPCWRRIIDEALRLRAGVRGGGYATPVSRRRDMIAFLEHAIARTREVAEISSAVAVGACR